MMLLKMMAPIALLAPAAATAVLSLHGTEDAPAHPGLYADIHTNRGTITVALEPQRAPLATAAFVGLAEGTIENDAFDEGRPYYDGTRFHRVVPGHVIQAGEPDSERASDPGFVYPNEVHADLSHDREGVLGVANQGPHTNSAQWYITLDDRSYLDGSYIVFGEVVEGMDVVHAITEGDRVDSVRVARRSQEAEHVRPDTRSFQGQVREAEERVKGHRERRREAEGEWLQANVPELAEGLEPDEALEEVRTTPLPDDALPQGAAPGEDAPEGALHVRYRLTALEYRGDLLGYSGPPLEPTTFVSDADGEPEDGSTPQTFPFRPGETEIVPGLDELLAELEPGDAVAATVPAELGYGSAGHFGPEPEEPGDTRVMIPPNTLLVYELEVQAP